MRIKFGNQKGAVFVTTLICSGLMVMIGGYTYQATSSHFHYVTQMKRSAQAQELADAGLSKALSQLAGDFSLASSAASFPSTNLGSGSYDVTISNTGSRYLVSSAGTVPGATRTATAEVAAPSPTALDYMFAAGGNATIDSGTGQSPGTIVGDIYGAGNVTLDGPSSGGVLAITGSVDAGGSITTAASATVSGSSTANYGTSIPFPTVSMAYYQAIANTNGTYINGDTTYNVGSPIPASVTGNVIYVNGNITIEATQSTTASIFATGNITIQKSGSTYPRVTVSPPTVGGVKYPAIVSSGNFTFTSNGNGGAYLTVNGLVYPQGNFTFSSGNHDTLTINGSVLARGNITVSPTAQNSVSASYVSQNPPGFTNGVASMTIKSYND
jgi:hypothetical protein